MTQGDTPVPFLGAIKRIAHRWGVDRTVALILLGRLWSMIASPITLWCIASRLNGAQQGYYYTFSGVLAVSMLAELGLAIVITQFASHEKAHLDWASDGTLQGNDAAKARLASLLRPTLAWYGVVSLLIVTLIMPFGLWFFSANPGEVIEFAWQAPWISLATLSAVGVMMLPIWALIEGCGLVRQIAWFRLVQQIGGSVVLWLALMADLTLFAPVLFQGFGLASALVWVIATKRALLWDLVRFRYGEVRISWLKEFWPLQWRVAVGCIGAFFVFYVPGPILFQMYGPNLSGQWGMSYQLATAVLPLGAAWINSRIPVFGTLVARRQFEKLDELFLQALVRSSLVVVFASAVLYLAIIGARLIHHPYASRLLPPLPTLLLVLGATLSHVAFSFTVYFRAHKLEPLLSLFIAIACFVPLAGSLLAYFFGVTGMASAYLIATGGILLGGAIWVFHFKRRSWRQVVVPA